MKYNLTDIIDFDVITIYQNYSLFTFILTIILEIFYATIVYFSTNKKMQFFRYLTFLYIFECILTETLLFCWKPVKLTPYTIIYPVGAAAPMSSFMSAGFGLCVLGCHGLMIDTLAAIVIERYYQIVSNRSAKAALFRFWTYFFMALTFITVTISVLFLVFWNIDDQSVSLLLETEVKNVGQLLKFQSSLFLLHFENLPLIYITFGSLFFYGICRVGMLFYILKDNYSFVKTTKINISLKTRKQLSLMFQATVTQFCTTLFFCLNGGIGMSTFFIQNNTTFAMKIFAQSCFGILMTYPIVDVLIVISVVNGYRNTVKKFIKYMFNVKKYQRHAEIYNIKRTSLF